jgi:hypothetical protein
MSKRMTAVVPAILVVLLVAALSTSRSSFAQRVADDCISKPSSAPPQGRHWYYRVDRIAQRQCWYLGPQGARVQAGARQDELTVRLPLPRPLAQAPVTTEVGAGKNDTTVNFARRWTGFPGPLGSTSDGDSEEQAITNLQGDMPLVWPVLAPVGLAASRPQAEYTVGSEHMFAIFAGALAFAAVMARSVLKRPGARAAAQALRQREQIPLARVNRPATARQAEAMRESAGAARRSYVPGRPGSSRHDADESFLPRQAGSPRPSRPTTSRGRGLELKQTVADRRGFAGGLS